MYEIVACLRELNLEAAGVTERVRLMKNITHKELCENPDLHVELMKSQVNIETELAGRSETQIAILDRCLLDYVLLANQTFPGMDFSKFVPEVTNGLSMDQYLAKFTKIIMPMDLLQVSDSGKVRPDEDFRTSEIATFWKARGYPNVEFLYGKEYHLGERCKIITNMILNNIGRSDIFRDYYLINEVSDTVSKLLRQFGINTPSIYISGSMSKKFPTLPAYTSDIDLFFVANDEFIQKYILEGNHNIDNVAKYLFYMFGVNFHIMPISEEMSKVIKPLELVWSA